MHMIDILFSSRTTIKNVDFETTIQKRLLSFSLTYGFYKKKSDLFSFFKLEKF